MDQLIYPPLEPYPGDIVENPFNKEKDRLINNPITEELPTNTKKRTVVAALIFFILMITLAILLYLAN